MRPETPHKTDSAMERTAVIIVAGGSGRRCGGGMPKQFRLLDGMPVLARTLNRFAEALPGAELVAVLPERYAAFWKNLAARFDVARHTTVTGGKERFHSVRRGLEALATTPELIAVQDGVRPLGSVEMIRRVAEDAARYGAAIPVVEPVDSFRRTEGAASCVVDRSRLRIVQTPQIFRADLLTAVYATAYDPAFTDDASVVERFGHAVHLSAGERTNIKLTAEEDFIIAEALLRATRAKTDDEHL